VAAEAGATGAKLTCALAIGSLLVAPSGPLIAAEFTRTRNPNGEMYIPAMGEETRRVRCGPFMHGSFPECAFHSLRFFSFVVLMVQLAFAARDGDLQRVQRSLAAGVYVDDRVVRKSANSVFGLDCRLADDVLVLCVGLAHCCVAAAVGKRLTR
jgi:hypothetical protein